MKLKKKEFNYTKGYKKNSNKENEDLIWNKK